MKRKYTAIYCTEKEVKKFDFLSEHYAHTKANIEDAKREFRDKYGRTPNVVGSYLSRRIKDAQ